MTTPIFLTAMFILTGCLIAASIYFLVFYVMGRKPKKPADAHILPIMRHGHAILQSEARALSKTDMESMNIRQLAKDMFATLQNAGGIGLAAPQVGHGVRLIVIDTTRLPFDRNVATVPGVEPVMLVMVNTEILVLDDRTHDYPEGCLSFPGLPMNDKNIKRHLNIMCMYQDEHYLPHVRRFTNLTARVIQHEIDHLNGLCIIDRVTSAEKRMALTPHLKDISFGKIKTKYPMM